MTHYYPLFSLLVVFAEKWWFLKVYVNKLPKNQIEAKLEFHCVK